MTNTFGLVRKEWDPHKYQMEACTTMLKQRAVGLFMDPGLGKTSIVLNSFKALKAAGLVSKLLVVAPIRPMYNVWPAEIEKWSNFNDLSWCIVHGKDKEEKLDWEADVFLINPEAIQWLFNFRREAGRIKSDTDRIDRMGVDCLCIDESTRFKNAGSQRFKALARHLSPFKIRWCLTGTPTPNGIQDLFGQIFILDQGRALGRYITHFRNTFMYPSPHNPYSWEMQEGAFQRVTALVAPLVVQIKAKDHLDMPELINNYVRIDLPEAAMQTYREVENEFIAQIEDGTIIASNAGVAGTKCRQIANGAVYTQHMDDVNSDMDWLPIHTAKTEALLELLEELGDKPVLVLYEYRHDMERMAELLGDRCAVISGASPKKADEMILRFNHGTLPVLLGHPASMGHGINLQGTCYNVVWFGITWNLEHYQQAIARVYRQGQQSKTVIVHHIVANHTLDERVLGVLDGKDSTQENILAALRGRQ